VLAPPAQPRLAKSAAPQAPQAPGRRGRAERGLGACALTGCPARPQAVEKLGYEKPSPIQMAAIPLGLQFRDVIGVAETGSGKTAAFVLPMLTYIMKQPVMTEALAAEGPYAVIMAPTRELALQIEARARARAPAHAAMSWLASKAARPAGLHVRV